MKRITVTLIILGAYILSNNAQAFQFSNTTDKTIIAKVYSENKLCYETNPLKAGALYDARVKSPRCQTSKHIVKAAFLEGKKSECLMNDVSWNTNIEFSISKEGEFICKEPVVKKEH